MAIACSISIRSPVASPTKNCRYPSFLHSCRFSRRLNNNINGKKIMVKAMVQQAVQGSSAAYAKEMERLSAKESLLLALKDAGGFEALVTGKTTDMQRIDVNERIYSYSRATQSNASTNNVRSPYLDGRWNFEWFGSGSPGLFAARLLFERLPSALAYLSKLDVVIKDGSVNIEAYVKFFNSIENNVILSTKLSFEGPLRLKEEYVEGVIKSPKINEENVPVQLRGAFDQAASTLQQIPDPIKDAMASGFKVPIGGTFYRLFMISYLDEEILITRDTAGVPEVLTRLDPAPSPVIEPVPDYES